ncbi:MAG TPA: SDR family oxidoreductase [Actinomycetota bacterium]|nr:SDR family oxidoreductase [Actinomycetota bacterium]
MGICDGRVVIVTGAGRGIGRGHALEFAKHGAKVIVNDLGKERDDSGTPQPVAQQVVDEIKALGGEALANADDVSDWNAASSLIDQAYDAWGKLDVLVNNAGILRDRMLFNMEEQEWDDVIRVHLKGTFCPTRHATARWRELAKSGEQLDARIINTTSTSGIYGNPGQANYGAAKAGIASFTIILSRELEKYGITVNAISPGALTRMTSDLGNRPAAAEGSWDPRDPDNIAPIAVWLGSAESKGVTGRVFHSSGGRLGISEGWHPGPMKDKEGRWDPAELGPVVAELIEKAEPPYAMGGGRRR